MRLHLLRFVVGDEHFRNGVRLYARENVGRGVVTDDFRRAMERAAGRSLERFFQQWFLSPGFPEFAVAWDWDEDERTLRLVVEQVQESRDGTPAVFELPVEVEVRTTAGARSFRLELDERRNAELERPGAALRSLRRPRLDPEARARERRRPSGWRSRARRDVNARRGRCWRSGRLAGEARAPAGVARAWAAHDAPRDGSPLVVRMPPRPSLRVSGRRWGGEAAAEAGVEAETRCAPPPGRSGPRVRSAARRAPSFDPRGSRQSGRGLFRQARATARAYRGALASAAPSAPSGSGRRARIGSPRRAGGALAPAGCAARHACPRRAAPACRGSHARPDGARRGVRALASSPRERVVNSRFLVPFWRRSFHLRGAAVDALASFGDGRAPRAPPVTRARTSPERRTIEALLARRGSRHVVAGIDPDQAKGTLGRVRRGRACRARVQIVRAMGLAPELSVEL